MSFERHSLAEWDREAKQGFYFLPNLLFADTGKETRSFLALFCCQTFLLRDFSAYAYCHLGLCTPASDWLCIINWRRSEKKQISCSFLEFKKHILQNLLVCILTVISNCQGTACTLLLFQKPIVCVVDRRHFGSKVLPNSLVQQGEIFLLVSLLLLSSPSVPLPTFPSFLSTPLSLWHGIWGQRLLCAKGWISDRVFRAVICLSDFLTIEGSSAMAVTLTRWQGPQCHTWAMVACTTSWEGGSFDVEAPKVKKSMHAHKGRHCCQWL